MSGHSKWNNIKRKKEKTDAERAKVFTKMGREIAVAVREGGADPAVNGKLRDVIAKAKAANVPNDNIERIIKKSSGDKTQYETILYEGYGPGGVAVIVETLTDNRNRTASDMRHYFDKYGGNLGTTGCVSFMFTEKGVIEAELEDRSEDAAMEDCFEAGGDDINFEQGVAEILTSPAEFRAVREYFESKGYVFRSADVEFIPSTLVRVEEPLRLTQLSRLFEKLEENDDVQNYWHNVDNPEDLP
ncbi:MAG: YebC/PmpR family DNA-binding transcriptional regulator [Oscillospiraceae bacterium]|nr:YebC/PmpR family DNA-binding transcriptional regulator [Oscillospiraceae bacterium]